MTRGSPAKKAAAGLVAALFLGSAGLAHAAARCDHACLEGMVDLYMKGLVAHDASRLPLATDVKYTENGQNLPLNRGLWETATGDAGYRIYAVDPANGQVGFVGVMDENSQPAFLALRLKVVEGKISEAEAIVARKGERLFAPENMTTPRPEMLETLKPSERASREEMIRIANSYFRGLDEENSGSNVPFATDCQRTENGVTVANSTDPAATPIRKMGCKAQIDTGFSVIVTDIRDRRFPVVDVERGLVLTFAFFDHAGKITSAPLRDGSTLNVTAPFNHPFTWETAALFKIRNGKILRIEAVLATAPYRMKSGW